MAKKETKKLRGIYEKVPGSEIWWIRYSDATGRIRREKAGLKQTAINLYRIRKTEVLQGKKLPEPRKLAVSFQELVKDALAYSRGNKGHESYRNDKWNSELLLTWFRGREAEGISPQEIERKLAELAEDERSPATINRYRALLSLIYSLACRNGKVTVNPARLVRLRKENNARIRYLTADEEKALREKIRTLYPEREPEFDLALNTGMRRGEQFRLRKQDVNLAVGMITIPQSKHGYQRHIPINPTARRSFELLCGRVNGEYVCSGPKGLRGRDSQRWFEECVTEAKISSFTWHCLRHTFASRLVMAGVDLRTTQELMGHKTIAMTCRYAHLAPAHLREAVDRLTLGPTDTKTSTGNIVELPVADSDAA